MRVALVKIDEIQLLITVDVVASALIFSNLMMEELNSSESQL
jgi:hypothetical protein